MRKPRFDTSNNGHRATRWDKLVKKRNLGGTTTNNLKNDAIKRLIEMDFIGKKQEQHLLNYNKHVSSLNPLVVMDMRHEMFKRLPRSLPLATVQFKKNDDWCKQHNILVEERHIANELNKFREQMARQQRQRHYTTEPYHINNEALIESLKKTSEHIEDFYTAPLEVFDEMQDMFKKAKENQPQNNDKQEMEVKEEEHLDKHIIELIQDIECSECESQIIGKPHVRCVRFEEHVKIESYDLQRENSCASNGTSDGIDSVISDLAEEALQELRQENEEKKKANKNETETETDQAPKHSPLIVRRIEITQKQANDDTIILSVSENEDSSVSNHEQNKIIEQLFQSRAHTNIVILRKYFLKWLHYTHMEKIARESSVSCKTNRLQQINTFLNKIRTEKTRLKEQDANAANENGQAPTVMQKNMLPQITKKYQNKIKMQQDIIDLQKIKLERQERIIMELKLHKLSEEAKEAREELKNELKNVIKSGDPKTKAKAKCLQLIGNLRDKQEQEDASRLQGKSLLVPQFLLKMQERALERSVKHEQAKQRRLQQEAEREALKTAAEEARRLEDEEAKQQRIEALKEKRRQEKMQKIQRERQRQRAIENHRKSQAFCRLYLLRRVGFEAFKRLLARKQENKRNSESLRSHIYKRTYFRAWKAHCAQKMQEKLLSATFLHEKQLKRFILSSWTYYVQQERSNYLVAVDWHDLHVTEKVFKVWCYYVTQHRINLLSKMRQAVAHHEWHTKWKVLDCWQRLSHILQIERETEARRQRWRLKIWELLPDYEPNRDDN